MKPPFDFSYLKRLEHFSLLSLRDADAGVRHCHQHHGRGDGGLQGVWVDDPHVSVDLCPFVRVFDRVTQQAQDVLRHVQVVRDDGLAGHVGGWMLTTRPVCWWSMHLRTVRITSGRWTVSSLGVRAMFDDALT